MNQGQSVLKNKIDVKNKSEHVFQHKAAHVQRLKEKLIICLEEKRQQRDEMHQDLLRQERAIMIKIRDQIRSSLFKRAYKNEFSRDAIEICLKDLKGYKLEKGKSVSALRKISNILNEILKWQAEEEQRVIVQIEKQFDGKQWEQLRRHFEDDCFLNSLWVMSEIKTK